MQDTGYHHPKIRMFLLCVQFARFGNYFLITSACNFRLKFVEPGEHNEHKGPRPTPARLTSFRRGNVVRAGTTDTILNIHCVLRVTFVPVVTSGNTTNTTDHDGHSIKYSLCSLCILCVHCDLRTTTNTLDHAKKMTPSDFIILLI